MLNRIASRNTITFLTALGLTAGMLGCQRTDEPEAIAPLSASSNAENSGDYLIFSSQAEFEETQNTIDDLQPGEGIDAHLAKWEEQHGSFYSMRRYYADLEQQGDSSSIRPITDSFFRRLFHPKG